MNQPTPIIVTEYTGREVNPHRKPKYIDLVPYIQSESNKLWLKFERSVKSYPCPSIANTEPGETVLAYLVDQRCENPEDRWPDGSFTRQIWVPIVEQKERGGKFGEWVSVEDRSPERKVWVIGYKEGQSKDDWTHPIDQRIMYYTGPGEWSGWMKDTGYTFTPTHWMPLPSPPITEK